METIGASLRAIRLKWGLTLREVEERTERLAKEWGKPSYRISASWLDRVEREGRSLSAEKLIVLAAVYSIPAGQLLGFSIPRNSASLRNHDQSSPNTTLLLTGGPLEEHARAWFPDILPSEPIPDETMLLAPVDTVPNQYRRGIIGRRDLTLEPMIRAGSIVLINTQRRSIAHRREWKSEFDRPIYFLLSRGGYFCGWCELDKEGEWLTLVPHPLSYATPQRWRYRKEVEVIGRVSVVLLRLEEMKTTG